MSAIAALVVGTCGLFAGLACSPARCPPQGPPPGPGKPPRPRCQQWMIGRAPLSRCGRFPWLPEAVRIAATSGLQHGYEDPDDLSLYVATHVYPLSPDGQPLSWPPKPGDPAAVRCIWNRVLIRVHRYLADLADELADQS